MNTDPNNTNPLDAVKDDNDGFFHPHDCPQWKQEQGSDNFLHGNNNTHVHKSTQASFRADVPLLVWDGTQYQLDYNHNHRPISVQDGTTHTNIVYDDNDDDATNDYTYDDYDECGYTYDYAYGDFSNMNNPSVRLQFKKCLQTVQ